MVDFYTLWSNHPGKHSSPCEFTNQCAIRMGISLEKSDVNTASFNGVRCWHGHSPGHILRAQELANWITKNSGLFGARKVYKNVTSADFSGKKGIVFVKNGWGPTDHIDLWDGSMMIGGYNDYFEMGDEIWFWNLA